LNESKRVIDDVKNSISQKRESKLEGKTEEEVKLEKLKKTLMNNKMKATNDGLSSDESVSSNDSVN
jgi:hypothetical protein